MVGRLVDWAVSGGKFRLYASIAVFTIGMLAAIIGGYSLHFYTIRWACS